MRNLYKKDVDLTTVDNLVSGTLVPCKVIAAPLSAGTGILPRGTLLTAAAGGSYGKATGTDVHGVLLLDIDISDADERVGAPIACSGEFNQNKIEEAMDATVAIGTILNGRARQIYIAPMAPAPEAF